MTYLNEARAGIAEAIKVLNEHIRNAKDTASIDLLKELLEDLKTAEKDAEIWEKF